MSLGAVCIASAGTRTAHPSQRGDQLAFRSHQSYTLVIVSAFSTSASARNPCANATNRDRSTSLQTIKAFG
jgi:hypothetical protein